MAVICMAAMRNIHAIMLISMLLLSSCPSFGYVMDEDGEMLRLAKGVSPIAVVASVQFCAWLQSVLPNKNATEISHLAAALESEDLGSIEDLGNLHHEMPNTPRYHQVRNATIPKFQTRYNTKIPMALETHLKQIPSKFHGIESPLKSS